MLTRRRFGSESGKRYSPPGRSPTLTAEAVVDTVTVSVIDHGTGTAPDQRERVFEPFHPTGRPAHGRRSRARSCQGLNDAVGGRITAITVPNGGLTMRVDLPAAAPTHDTASAAP
jgi:two-component system, OmpR family, sensor histidine kinase KdpD